MNFGSILTGLETYADFAQQAMQAEQDAIISNLPCALLGDVTFQLAAYFQGEQRRMGAEFAEHKLIDGKPRLQWTGDRLDEITWTVLWHAARCNPEAEYQKVLALLAAHSAAPLFTADGDYRGTFVVESFDATTRWTTPGGTLLMLEGSITLKEFVQPASNVEQNASQPPVAAQQATPGGASSPPGTVNATPAARNAGAPVTRN